jgi:hypothetical protein
VAEQMFESHRESMNFLHGAVEPFPVCRLFAYILTVTSCVGSQLSLGTFQMCAHKAHR